MLDDDQVQGFIRVAKINAERSINEDLEKGDPNPSFPSHVGVFFDGKTYPEIWLYPPNPGPDQAGSDPVLFCCNAAIIGMEADAVMTVNDSFGVKGDRFPKGDPAPDASEDERKAFEDQLIATGRFNRDENGKIQLLKRDGTPWGRGDMQRAWLNKTEDAQDLTMAVMLCYYERGGDTFMAHLEYEHRDGKLAWTEEKIVKSSDEKATWSGHMPETIKEMFQAPTISDSMRESMKNPGLQALHQILSEAGSVDEQQLEDAFNPFAYREQFPLEARAHQNCAVIKSALIGNGVAIAVGIGGNTQEEADKVAEIYRRSLQGGEGAPMPEGVEVNFETIVPERGVEGVKPKEDVL